MEIYIILVLVTIIIAAIILFPLWQRRADQSLGAGLETDGDIAAWVAQKDQITLQMSELEFSFAQNKIDKKAYKVEKERLAGEGESILKALQNSRKSSHEGTSKNVAQTYPSFGVVLGIGFVVATTGLSIYLSNQLATPDPEMAMTMPMRSVAEPSAAKPSAQVSLFPEQKMQEKPSVPMPQNPALLGTDGQPDIGAMVAQLEERIKDDNAPLNDVMMLAQSYGVLGRDDEAIALYERAMGLAPDNFSVLMTTSEFMSRSEDEKIRLKGEELADKVLAKNPEYPEAMWIKSLSLLKRHKVDEATLILHQLRPLVLDNPKATSAINSLLDRLAKLPPSSG